MQGIYFLMGFGKFCKSKNAGKGASKQVSKQAILFVNAG